VTREEEEEDLFLCEFADGYESSDGASQYAEKGIVDVSIVASGASTA
jgi:hypothetical protein